ncbi:MAG: hypothetical protein JHC33_00885 [Ignisphaera sp.]|nr:hypothetical protein [Ignisphaera sp.]
MDTQSHDNQPKTAEDYLAFAEQITGKTSARPLEAMQTELNELVKQVTISDDGKFIYPDGTPDHLRLALGSEKKFRDTQSAYTRSQQALKEAEEAKDALLEQLASQVPAGGLSDDEVEHLEELKYTDPEAWYKERQALESRVTKAHRETLTKEQELRNRHAYLARVNADREVAITPELLDNDIPPRINNKLRNGELTFEAYIAEVAAYMDKGRVVSNPELNGDTKLTSGGSGTLTTNNNQAIDYSKITF